MVAEEPLPGDGSGDGSAADRSAEAVLGEKSAAHQRAAALADLTFRIDRGTYAVAAEDVADAMIRHFREMFTEDD